MSKATSTDNAKPLVKPIVLLLAIVAVSSLLFTWIRDSKQTNQAAITPDSAQLPDHKSIDETYGRMEMSFEANQGQTDSSVNFLARGVGYTLFLKPNEATFSLSVGQKKENDPKNAVAQPGLSPRSSAVRLKIVGGNANAKPVGENRLDAKTNYFIGNDPDKWRRNLPNFGRVRYSEIYKGIDIEYYGNQKQLEYDFRVAPGADYRQISVRFEGADSVKLEQGSGDLLVEVDGETLRQLKPIVYQQVAGERIEVESRFLLDEANRVSFQVADHDKSLPLVIDPVLMYSTYLGGNGEDRGNSIAVDLDGNAYVAGRTSSTNFPTVGAIRSTPAGYDIFITKLNPAGSAMVYSTYFGGSGSDSGNGIAVDTSGNVYVTGETDSENFPAVGPLQGNSFDVDAFITKIDPTGSTILSSTYLGGNSFERANAIAIDQERNIYITGYTHSTDFPTVNAVRTTNAGYRDVFVTRLNSNASAISYSTYLGTVDEDIAYAIAVDNLGQTYVTGATTGRNFPIANAIQSTNASQFGLGGHDAFVTKLSTTGSSLVYSTYLGGNSTDEGLGIALDSSGNAHITGSTESTNFPTLNPLQGTRSGTSDAFVAKINAQGSALVYSTYLGGAGGNGPGQNGRDSGFGIAVDGAGAAYVTGRTSSANFPLAEPLFSIQMGGNDAFVTKVNPQGSALLFSTYMGGVRDDAASSIGLDSAGAVYITGTTISYNFPTLNPIQGTAIGLAEDIFISKIAESGIPPTPIPTPTPTPSPTPTPAPSPMPPVAGDLVISQIYGNGGTAGATYRNSYVEIFNRKDMPVVVNAYAVALGLGTGAIDRSYGRTSSQNIVIQPGQYMLVRMGSGGGNGAELPQPDVDAQTQPPGFPSSFFGVTGKLALTGQGANNSIFTNCPLGATGLFDFVGFGSTNCFEGGGSVTGLSSGAAALRRNSGCTDTNNNASDFTIGAPNPRNTSSPFTPCSGQVVATPTPTPIATPTPTPTQTPTPTPSPMPTPTPAPIMYSISGRTITEAGNGIRNLIVTLTRDDDARQTVTTSSFGFYSFEGLQPGRTYTLAVRSKRFRFAPRVVQLSVSVTDINMIALE